MARPSKYPEELRERAVRMVAEVAPQDGSQWAAITAVAGKLGVGAPEAVRTWVRRAEVKHAVGPDVPAVPVLLGHDLGGGVAQIAAVRAPERFSGLVLTNTVCYDSWPIPSVKAMARTAAVLRHMSDVAIYPSFVQLLRSGQTAATSPGSRSACIGSPMSRTGRPRLSCPR